MFWSYLKGMWVNLTGENTAVFDRHVGQPYRQEYRCIRQTCGSTLQARIQLYSTGMWVNLTGENTAVFGRHVGQPYRREYSCIRDRRRKRYIHTDRNPQSISTEMRRNELQTESINVNSKQRQQHAIRRFVIIMC